MKFKLLILTILLSKFVYGQDIILKKDKSFIVGKVYKIDSINVFFKEITDSNDSFNLILELSQISEIKFDYSRKFINKHNQSRSKNAISIAFGGTGGIISLNYYRVIFQNNDYFISAKVGLGSWFSQTNINIHLTGNYSFFQNRHFLEFGIGGAIGLSQFDKYYRYYISVPIIGYRIQPSSENFFFRTYASGYFMIDDRFSENILVPMIGLDFGYSF